MPIRAALAIVFSLHTYSVAVAPGPTSIAYSKDVWMVAYYAHVFSAQRAAVMRDYRGRAYHLSAARSLGISHDIAKDWAHTYNRKVYQILKTIYARTRTHKRS